MATLIAVPIFALLIIFQSAITSRITLAYGVADLILLTIIAWGLNEKVETAWHWRLIGGIMTSIVPAVPFGALFIGYLLATFIALLLRKRVWKVPILAMFVATFIGTLIIHLFTIISRWISGVTIPIIDSFYYITLPTLILNLLLAVPRGEACGRPSALGPTWQTLPLYVGFEAMIMLEDTNLDDPYSFYAEAQFGDTAKLAGIVIIDANGNPIPGATISADSGQQYPASPIPEPGTHALLFAGLTLLGWQARPRKQRIA